MENRKELLEQYMEDGKLPLKGELFARKSVVGGKLEEFREEKRADALTSRPNAAGRQKLIVLRSSYLLESSGPVYPAFRNRRLLLSVGREDYV
jgi:hypothetical protein